jgi:hypothetical protein
MAATYPDVKATVIDLIDDFSELDVVAGYGDKYNAKTELASLGISAPVLAVMPPRFNKRLQSVVGPGWQNVGAIDLVAQKTIGDLVLLACGQSSTVVPDGEPK